MHVLLHEQIFVDEGRNLVLFSQAKVGSSTLGDLANEYGWKRLCSFCFPAWRKNLTDQRFAQYRLMAFKRPPEGKFRSGSSEVWFRIGIWQSQ